MSRLLELQEKLRDTSAAIAELERAAIKEPYSPSLGLMAKSLEKRRLVLDSEFSTEADNLGIDVCTYRMLGDRDHQTLRALVQALGGFQTVVSVVYDAVKTKVPKIRAPYITAELARETEFGFGYTFPGSVGVVLTLPNDRLLFGESWLDESFSEISNIIKAKDSSQISSFAKRLGVASVRALYSWAFDHDRLGLGASIEWRRAKTIRNQLLTQQPEFEEFHKTIEQLSEQTITEREIVGQLEGADVIKKTFHIKLDDGEDIKGSFTDAISEEQTVELPKRYRAIVIRTEQIKYSTEQEIVSYHLTNLEPIQL